jgi:Carboxypeptidase regulatory-like domain
MLPRTHACGFFLTFTFLLSSGAAFAQVSAIVGDVIGTDGRPVKGASILIEREDMNGTYRGAKTDKIGHFIYNGLPLGTYRVTVILDGQIANFVDKVRTRLGDPIAITFDMRAQEQPATQKAAETSTIANGQERGRSNEQIQEYEKRAQSPTRPDTTSQIKTEIEQIESGGQAFPLPEPAISNSVGSSSNASWSFENKTPYILVVLLSGPVEKRIALPAGSKQTLDIPSGKYKVAARLLAPDFPPLFGVQEYVSGHDYKSDFVIQ